MIVLWLTLIVVGLGVAVPASARGVDDAVKAAIGLGLPPFAVGFTLVAVGTDLPEIANSIMASVSGHGDVNAGDSIGSAVAQATIVIGLAPFLARRGGTVTRREVAVLGSLAVAVLLVGAAVVADGDLSRADGSVLVMSWVVAVSIAWRWTKQAEQPELPLREHGAWKHALRAAGWLTIVLGSASLAVLGLTRTTEILGMPEYVVSFFGLAVGTSLPELTVVVSALRRGHADLALGDALGAVLADGSLSMGIGPLIAPTAVTADLAIRGGLVAAGAVAGVTGILIFTGRLNRISGGLLILMYLLTIPMLL